MNKEEAKVRIDSIINHLEWRHGGGTDYVESDHDQAHQIIDQIEPDHPKVKLPREVGEELDAWKFRWGIDVGEYLASIYTSGEDTPKAQEWREAGVTVTRSTQLAEAFNHGWEAEPEERFYVEAPEIWNAAVGQEYRWVSMCDGEFNLTVKGQSQTFTRAELKKYHLDSDIFTLVPVEADKEVSR